MLGSAFAPTLTIRTGTKDIFGEETASFFLTSLIHGYMLYLIIELALLQKENRYILVKFGSAVKN